MGVYNREVVMRQAREREREVMTMRRSGMTYVAIAERLGVTPGRARQIMAKGERIEKWKRLDLSRQTGGVWS